MKWYELVLEGYHTPLTAEQIAGLFRAGRVCRVDGCREVGQRQWRTIDELFPLLKYDSTRTTSGAPPAGRGRIRSPFDGSDEPGDVVRPMSSALKAGWICFGIGLTISWFFPLGQAFFSVALITAIVAMCTHQVNRGLALLISSFVASGMCALIFFTLVIGTIGMAVAPVARQANADLRKAQATQTQALQQMNQASAQLQSNLNAFNRQTAPQSFANTPAVPFATSPTSDQQRQHELAMRRQREADAQRAADDRQREANVREAERQRDRSRAKEQHLEQLQASVDYWDRQVKDARLRGGDSRWLEAQREDAWSKKQEFVGR